MPHFEIVQYQVGYWVTVPAAPIGPGCFHDPDDHWQGRVFFTRTKGFQDVSATFCPGHGYQDVPGWVVNALAAILPSVKGVISPAGINPAPEKSLFFNLKPSCHFLDDFFPGIGVALKRHGWSPTRALYSPIFGNERGLTLGRAVQKIVDES